MQTSAQPSPTWGMGIDAQGVIDGENEGGDCD